MACPESQFQLPSCRQHIPDRQNKHPLSPALRWNMGNPQRSHYEKSAIAEGWLFRQSMWLQRSTNFHHLNPRRFSGPFWIVVTTPKPPARRNMTGMYSPPVSLCIGSPGFFCRRQASV